MTHEEKETQHEISKVHEQVHQISLSQRATKNEMDGLKKAMEAKMNGLKAKIGRASCRERVSSPV